MKKNESKSLLMISASMVIWGSVGIFRRFIPLPSAVLACSRGVIGTIFLILLVKLQQKQLFHHIGRKTIGLLILSGAVMGVNWILLFEAYNYTSVAAATLCYYMAPTIVVLLSPLLFREKITLRKGICAVLAVVGMVFVSGIIESGIPSVSEFKGILFGLGAAVLYASVVILNKLLPGIDPFEKTIIQLASSAAVLFPYILLSGQTVPKNISSLTIVMVLIVGLLHTGIAYAMYFGSVDNLRAQTVALLSYLDPITALILSALILGEKMTVFGIIGAVLIIGAAVVSEMDTND
ncbi:MAG: EamA family transporter [Anaerolineaceae bacterium]|nr:EamA family transporter [Anaerolineaceae bacterium]